MFILIGITLFLLDLPLFVIEGLKDPQDRSVFRIRLAKLLAITAVLSIFIDLISVFIATL